MCSHLDSAKLSPTTEEYVVVDFKHMVVLRLNYSYFHNDEVD